MIDPGTLAVYVLAALTLAVVPGPAVLYIVGQSLQGGRAAGLVSALGVAAGALVHVAASVVGVSALLAASAEAFTAVKLAGAAYLIWLGVSTLLRRGGDRVGGHRPQRSRARTFRRGVVVNVLNPKMALFFLAFLPQFVDPEGPVRLQLALLGGIWVLIALASDTAWALVTGTASIVLRRSAAFARVQRWVSGSIFLGLGVVTALAGSHGRSD